MKNKNRRLVAFAVTIALIINALILYSQPIFAHEEMLEVTYDDCIFSDYGDDMNEMWYILNWFNEQYHLSQDEYTIRYYFEDSSEDGLYTWTTDISESKAQEIKEAYANSMKKWNNVYFYFYNDDGTVTKNKMINVVEGNESNCNLKIYPSNGLESIASTGKGSNKEEIEIGEIRHNHYQNFKMTVYVNYFYEHTVYDHINDKYIYISEAYASTVRKRTGAHEIGHVLGLYDVDYNYEGDFICGNADAISQHHEEILMGYGSPMTARSSEITYKDIAGVAITRGFHTDSDHKWLNFGMQDNGTYKLLCSICNGVIYVDSLSDYTYDTYGLCGGNHNLSDGNMMAVASYGDQDYYKCKYCRYVAPFSSIVTQNYTKSYYSDSYHKCENQVLGLEYAFYEEHTLNNHFETYSTDQHKAYCECGEYILQDHLVFGGTNCCGVCGEPHTHDYTDHYARDTALVHKSYCACGASIPSAHVVSGSVGGVFGRRICIFCGEIVDSGLSIMSPVQLPHTENGSYIMPNGIIVLMDEDMTAYLEGTLEFIYPTDEEIE